MPNHRDRPQTPTACFPPSETPLSGHVEFYPGAHRGVEAQTTYSDRIAKATTDMDLILDFVDHVRNRPASDNEHRWLTEALHHVNRVTAQDVK